MKRLSKVKKSLVVLASFQQQEAPKLQIPIFESARASSPNAKAIRCIQFLILASVAAVVGVKAGMLAFGLVDPLVGVYEVIIISNAFMPFFFAFTRYRDPSFLSGTKRGLFWGLLPMMRNERSGEGPAAEPQSLRMLELPLVSVIIPVYNEVRLIRQAIEAVLRSSYPRLEVIIVDDCSTDGSAQEIDSTRALWPGGKIKVLHLQTNGGKRRAIREGILQGPAAGEIFVFIDSDCVVDRYAVEKLVRSFSDQDVGAVAGNGKVLEPDRNALAKIQDTWYDGQFGIMKAMESTFGTVTCCPGILAAYRREALLPCLDRWCSETFLGKPFDSGDDRQMTSYLLGGTRRFVDRKEKAWKAKYCESAVVKTDVPSTLGQLVRQQVRWKKSWARAFVFSLPFFYRDRSPVAVASFYIQVASSFIAPLVAFRSLVLLPAEGVYLTALSYLAGVLFVDLLFAIEYKLRNPASGDRWLFRLAFSFLSIAVLDWLIYYSLVTIRNNSWLTRRPATQGQKAVA